MNLTASIVRVGGHCPRGRCLHQELDGLLPMFIDVVPSSHNRVYTADRDPAPIRPDIVRATVEAGVCQGRTALDIIRHLRLGRSIPKSARLLWAFKNPGRFRP
jgi:hypothetical protein